MTGLLILIPVALGLGLTGLAAFFWSVRDGQYDDMDGAALRVLVDDSDGPLPFKPHLAKNRPLENDQRIEPGATVLDVSCCERTPVISVGEQMNDSR